MTRSLSIRLPQSAARVEVLHDRLLAMLEADPTLAAGYHRHGSGYRPATALYTGDCLAPPALDRWLPWAILRPSRPRVAPRCCRRLSRCSLPDSRFASEDVLALLDVPGAGGAALISRKKGLRHLRPVGEQVRRPLGMDDDNVRELDLHRRPGSIHGGSASPMLLGYAMDGREENGGRCCRMTNPADDRRAWWA
ncbi:hypothetical protein MJ579_23285 [Klebsiella pneumoniae]|nr:hypothetical protein MJ579_23285 [Klebsiella pneumoniae]